MRRFRIIDYADRAAIDAMFRSFAPVFVLSTGRSGSKFAAELLALAPELLAVHEPRPTLAYYSGFALRNQDRPEVLDRMIEAARMEMVLDAFIAGRTYVESNQCLSFFAPSLARVFASAKFVHLVRHPGDFVSSAARKGWYENDSIWEAGRVRPDENENWAALGRVDRLAWLWDFTNRFIAGALQGLPAARTMSCRFEDLVAGSGAVQALFAFCGGTVPDAGRAREIQARPVNALRIDSDEPPTMRKDPGFPAFRDWPAADVEKLRARAGGTARLLGYDI
jgi:hypothetical protein